MQISGFEFYPIFTTAQRQFQLYKIPRTQCSLTPWKTATLDKIANLFVIRLSVAKKLRFAHSV